MTQPWDVDDIIACFTLVPPEISFLGSNDPHNHLGKALLLKFFRVCFFRNDASNPGFPVP